MQVREMDYEAVIKRELSTPVAYTQSWYFPPNLLDSQTSIQGLLLHRLSPPDRKSMWQCRKRRVGVDGSVRLC